MTEERTEQLQEVLDFMQRPVAQLQEKIADTLRLGEGVHVCTCTVRVNKKLMFLFLE